MIINSADDVIQEGCSRPCLLSVIGVAVGILVAMQNLPLVV